MIAPAPTIHVLLPVHNRRATTEKFIRCLLTQTYSNWHLILIDDGSRDGTSEMARELVPSVTVVRGTGNWWWAGGLQQGWDYLRCSGASATDLVLIINDDTEFEPDFLGSGVAALPPASLLLAQAVEATSGEIAEKGVFWDWRRMRCIPIHAPTGFNCFSTRGLFLTVGDFLRAGGFHPVMLPHYLSDYEFTMRAQRRGLALVSDPRVRLRYDGRTTGLHGREGLSAWRAMKRELSIRSSGNPFYWTSFVLLASPLRHMPINVLRVWWGFLSPLHRKVDRRVILPARILLGRVKRKLIKMGTTVQW